MQVQEVEVRKGQVGYLVEEYLFSKQKVLGEKTLVRCNHYPKIKSNCRVRGHISGGQFSYSSGSSRVAHNHEKPKLAAIKVREAVRQKVQDKKNSDKKMGSIVKEAGHDVLDKMDGGNGTVRDSLLAQLPSKQAMARTGNYDERSRSCPARPSSLGDIDFSKFSSELETRNGSSFLVADSGPLDPRRVIIFALTIGLQLLAQATRIFVDVQHVQPNSNCCC